MLANRILHGVLFVTSIVVIPLQFVTTLLLGWLVSLTFGLLLLPMSLIWILLSFPILGASWLCSKIEWLRTPIGLVGIPWVVVANTFVALMPSMGEIEGRTSKLLLAECWPYSWEWWMFRIGKAPLAAPENVSLRKLVHRITDGVPLMERTVNRIAAGESLDPNV